MSPLGIDPDLFDRLLKEQLRSENENEAISMSRNIKIESSKYVNALDSGVAIDHRRLIESVNKDAMFVNANVEDVMKINPDILLRATTQSLNIETIMENVIVELGRIPTQFAVHRTIEFIIATTNPILGASNDDVDDNSSGNIPSYQEELSTLLDELNELVFVSKARVIMDAYPETIALSVRLVPSITDENTEDAMSSFEEILQSNKPTGLIELEVSITNKVVY